jgi:rod shape-determining protein MreD
VKIVKLLVLIVAILVVQSMFLNKYRWLQLIDLVLIINIYTALYFSQTSCIAISLSTGLMQDALTKGIMGMNAFSKTVLAFLISALSSRIVIKQPVLSFLVGLASVLDLLIIFGLHKLFNLSGFPLSPKMLGSAALMNALTSLLIFYFADKVRLKQEYA